VRSRLTLARRRGLTLAARGSATLARKPCKSASRHRWIRTVDYAKSRQLSIRAGHERDEVWSRFDGAERVPRTREIIMPHRHPRLLGGRLRRPGPDADNTTLMSALMDALASLPSDTSALLTMSGTSNTPRAVRFGHAGSLPRAPAPAQQGEVDVRISRFNSLERRTRARRRRLKPLSIGPWPRSATSVSRRNHQRCRTRSEVSGDGGGTTQLLRIRQDQVIGARGSAPARSRPVFCQRPLDPRIASRDVVAHGRGHGGSPHRTQGKRAR